MRTFVLPLLVVACAKTPRALYLDELDDNTEMMVVSHNLGTALRLRATYMSNGFRETLASERQRLLDPTDEDQAAFIARMNDDGSVYHDVVFTAETGMPDHRVVFGDNDDTWRVRLEADGTVEQLVTVYRVRRPSALHEQLYAHKNKFNELWIARFARSVATPQEIVFHVGSGFGHDELVFSGEQLQ